MKFWVDANGTYLGCFEEQPPEAVLEVLSPPKYPTLERWIEGGWKMPPTIYCVDDQGNYKGGFTNWTPPEGLIVVSGPPNYGLDTYDLEKNTWKPYEGMYAINRQSEFEKVSIGDQLDAIWKALEQLGLVANSNAPDGSPEKILSIIKNIKTLYPKPEEGLK